MFGVRAASSTFDDVAVSTCTASAASSVRCPAGKTVEPAPPPLVLPTTSLGRSTATVPSGRSMPAALAGSSTAK